MADFQPNPEVLVCGTVTGVRQRTRFLSAADREAGVVADVIGHEVSVLTRTGFVTVRYNGTDVQPPREDEYVVLAVEQNFWTMTDDNGVTRKGLTLGFRQSLGQTALSGIAAALPSVEPVASK